MIISLRELAAFRAPRLTPIHSTITITLMPRTQLELWNFEGTALVAARTEEQVLPLTPALVRVDLLRELDVCAQGFLDNARCERTREAYDRDWTAFQRWCEARSLVPLPASAGTLTRYLTHLAQSGRKMSTIRRARIAIGVMHADAGAARPDRDARVRTLERGIAKTYGAREDNARPLILEDLERALHTLGAGPRADRDRVLLLLGFWGAFRPSELAGVRIEQLTLREHGIRVLLAKSKADPTRRGVTVDIGCGPAEHLCAVVAVQRWLSRLRQATGPLLRPVLGDRVLEHGMSTRAISRVVGRVARCAALEHADEFTGHSLRAGLATSAYLRGVSEREIQAHGRWRDRRSLDRYIQLCAARDRPNLVTAFA